MKKPYRPILVLDFDGVIHSYSSGWKGASIIPDEAVPGAIEFILSALKQYEVSILSSRSHQWGGKSAMKRWLRSKLIIWLNNTYAFYSEEKVPSDPLAWREFDALTNFNPVMEPWDIEVGDWADSIIKQIKWPWFKPAALVTIDDRAMTFTGKWPDMDDINSFKPWNKKPAAVAG